MIIMLLHSSPRLPHKSTSLRPRLSPASTALSSAFPSTTQEYYDSVVEPIGAMCTRHLVDLSGRAPYSALVVGALVADVLLAIGFSFFAAFLALVTCSKALAICAVVASLGLGKGRASCPTAQTKRSIWRLPVLGRRQRPTRELEGALGADMPFGELYRNS